MDMKKILQAMDKGSKPAVKADDDMKRFVSIIAEGRGLTNRPTQAEQITTQHYAKKAKPVVLEKKMTTSIDKYFKLVEQEVIESAEKTATEKSAKAQRLAERAVKEVGGNYGHPSNLKKHVSQSMAPPENIVKSAMKGARVDNNRRRTIHREADEVDTVNMDIPLFMRLLEYAKEDAKTDMDLHHLVEKAIELSKGGSLSMDDYEDLIGNINEAHGNSKIYDKCWTGYKKVPGKKRGEPGSCEKK
jgi:hypothetical protein